MNRFILNHLEQWKTSPMRTPLLLRGARQVGKTWAVREFGKSFASLVEINFERDPLLAAAFKASLGPASILQKLSAYVGQPIIPGTTLLFFDEIQSCPAALRSLRFFFEELPALHVIAAGSLLEFALEDIASFGVGRITSLFLAPLCFGEFLEAAGLGTLGELLQQARPDRPLEGFLHAKLLEQLRIYQLIGGMPAVVDGYRQSNNILECQFILDRLLTGFHADFSKYRKKMPEARLDETLRGVARQAGSKFKYANVSNDAPGRTYKDSLELLARAGLVHKIPHTSGHGVPLGAEANPRMFKVLPFDIGLHQRMLGLNLGEHLLSGNIELINKGNLAEVFVGLELIATSSPHLAPELHYWQRETRSSQAEVDYLVVNDGRIIPVEVKSGTRGQMQSLHLFMASHPSPIGVRLSHENFGQFNNIRILPLYAAGHLNRYRLS